MTEFLTFHKNGQWCLHKAASTTQYEPASDYKPGSKQYKAYGSANLQGELHQDNGTKGELHNFGGGVRPKNGVNWKRVNKPKRMMESQYNARNPGVGD